MSPVADPSVQAAQPRAAKVLVLVAAYNGTRFLEDQISSILDQRGVDVHVLISVDASTDGTEELVDRLAASDPRLQTLPHGRQLGGAAANFFRLISDARYHGFDYVALADQDDVWFPDKLRHAQDMLVATDSHGYSSDVLSWSEDGKSRPLRKSARQTRYDHFFSSAGPGCTYVFTRETMNSFAEWLRPRKDVVNRIDYHDWLLYAWVRTTGRGWVIDPAAHMRYRQHSSNQLGSNLGIRAARTRLRAVSGGWFRAQILATADVLGCRDELPIALLDRGSVLDSLRLVAMSPLLRRSRREALALGALLLWTPVTRHRQRAC